MPAESSTSASAAATVSESTTTTTTTTISTKDVFISLPDTSSSSSSRRTLAFLIPGNPGLIGYYEEFLSQARDALQVQAGAGASVGVAGLSLGGFEVGSGDDGLKHEHKHEREQWVRDVQAPPRVQTEEKKSGRAWGNARGLFGLRDQIELCHARVEAIVEVMQRGVVGLGHGQGQGHGEEGGGGGGGGAAAAAAEQQQKVDVILIGHSVGAYIALEVVKLWNERCRADAGRWTWTPKAAILLMPTVIDLHKSPSGQLATPLLSTVPFVPELLQSAVSALRYGLPPLWLKRLVSRVTGMKEGQGLETTVNFVASTCGVNEALHLARDEVAQIRADKWGEEVWGAVRDKDDSADGSRVSPALYFLFAQQDHWVADATRKEIVDVRGGSARRIVIDEEEGLAHAWPLRSTGPVVKIVLPWIQEVLLEATERQQQASEAERM